MRMQLGKKANEHLESMDGRGIGSLEIHLREATCEQRQSFSSSLVHLAFLVLRNLRFLWVCITLGSKCHVW